VTWLARAIDRTGPDLEDITQLRRHLGRDLAARRKAAGMLQHELARKIGHTRASLSHAETGIRDKSRKFWQSCDDVLGTGTHFASSYDRIYAGHEPAPSPKAVATPALRLSAALKSGRDLAGTLAEYRLLGWPACPEPHGELALPTGQVADAFEVPRAVGVIAARSWLETAGKEDLVRGLPALPSPATHLAVIDAGNRWYFLTRPGSSPWPAPVPQPAGRESPASAPGRNPPPADGPAVIWHAGHSSVPLPPASATQAASWAYLPNGQALRLAPPYAVLHLLGRAASMITAPAALALPGGTLVTPAASAIPTWDGDLLT
jgi:hypothetical protein